MRTRYEFRLVLFSLCVSGLLACAGQIDTETPDALGDDGGPAVEGTGDGTVIDLPGVGEIPTNPNNTGNEEGEKPVGGGETPQPKPQGPQRVDGTFWRFTAKHGQLAMFERTNLDINANGELVLAPSGGQITSSDDYNRPHRAGLATSPVKEVRGGFDVALPHFEAETPPGTWVAVSFSARIGSGATARWTKPYRMAVWALDEGTVHRHSFGDQNDPDAILDTDQLILNKTATAYKMTVTLASANGSVPRLRALGASTTMSGRPPPVTAGDPSVYVGSVLDVKPDRQGKYIDGGVVCSPTTTNMLMNYWQTKLGMTGLADGVETTKKRVWDPEYRGYGNWTFNMAYAAARSQGRLSAFLTRVSSLAQVETLVKAGVPVAASVRYNNTTGPFLDNPASPNGVSGHLLLVRGFDAGGNVYVNDPAAGTEAGVARLYNRKQFEEAWRVNSDRMIYVIHPSDQELPVDPNGAY